MAHNRDCTSPRRNQCRQGTARAGRSVDPAHWNCRGYDAFQGPLRYHPISSAPWRWALRVPVTAGRWDWFNAALEPEDVKSDVGA